MVRQSGTTWPQRWRRSQRSTLAILTLHFFSGWKGSWAGRLPCPQLQDLLKQSLPPLKLSGGRHVFFKQRNDLACDGLAILLGAAAQCFVQFIGDVFDV